MANVTRRSETRDFGSILRFSVYAGLFVMTVAALVGPYMLFLCHAGFPPLSWDLLWILLGSFAVGFLGTLYFLLDSYYYVASRKKDVM